MGIGLAIASASVVAGLLIAAYVGATITAAVRTEEALLRERFGAEYDRYRSNGPIGRLAIGEATGVVSAWVRRSRTASTARSLDLRWRRCCYSRRQRIMDCSGGGGRLVEIAIY